MAASFILSQFKGKVYLQNKESEEDGMLDFVENHIKSGKFWGKAGKPLANSRFSCKMKMIQKMGTVDAPIFVV